MLSHLDFSLKAMGTFEACQVGNDRVHLHLKKMSPGLRESCLDRGAVFSGMSTTLCRWAVVTSMVGNG